MYGRQGSSGISSLLLGLGPGLLGLPSHPEVLFLWILLLSRAPPLKSLRTYGWVRCYVPSHVPIWNSGTRGTVAQRFGAPASQFPVCLVLGPISLLALAEEEAEP